MNFSTQVITRTRESRLLRIQFRFQLHLPVQVFLNVEVIYILTFTDPSLSFGRLSDGQKPLHQIQFFLIHSDLLSHGIKKPENASVVISGQQ
jgi:hypothetical protein